MPSVAAGDCRRTAPRRSAGGRTALTALCPRNHRGRRIVAADGALGIGARTGVFHAA